MNKLTLIQTRGLVDKNNYPQESVANSVIVQLYNLGKADDETAGGTFPANDITVNLLTNVREVNSVKGNISVNSAYENFVSYIQIKYPDLKITATNLYLNFQDPVVESVLLQNGIGDGVGITLPNLLQLLSVGTWFRNNTSIQSFNEFNQTGVATISNNAFQGCTSLTSITLPYTCTSIGSAAFLDCTSLLLFDWSNITSIGSYSFYNCTSLYANETVDLSLSSQNSYPEMAFAYTNIGRLILHFHINNINMDYRYPIHARMSALTYLDYSDTTIDKWGSSYGCSNVTTLILPSTITFFEYRMTEYLNSLRYFIILVEDPDDITSYPQVNGYTFSGNYNGGNADIYVKDDTAKTKYKQHSFWGALPNAENRIKALSDLPAGVWTTGLASLYLTPVLLATT